MGLHLKKSGVYTINTDLPEEHKTGNMDSKSESVSIVRRQYTHDDIEDLYTRDTRGKPTRWEKAKSQCVCDKEKAWGILTTLIPIIDVFRRYKRSFIVGDILAGLSAGFMHFPQGLGFGLLAGLTPIYGLYSTFFPIVFYVIFGTSQHVSFGTNAVLAILTSNILTAEFGEKSGITNSSAIGNDSSAIFEDELNEKAAVAAMASAVAGLLLLGMGIFRLGFITSYMSQPFIGAFTTAAAVHITTSQVSKMLGIKVSAYRGAGKLVLTYVDLFRKIATTNIADLLISIFSLTLLLVVKIHVNERFKGKLPIPIPMDLIIVILGTVVSYLADFNSRFGVAVVGSIPTGMPVPTIPDFSAASRQSGNAIVIGILAFAMTISMAKLCAKLNGYNINPNQELLAYGASNFISSFFSCFPSCVAPPRTMILNSMGSKTTLNGLSSAVLILVILMAAAPLFQSLPVSVLAAMIVASMKDLLLQFRQLKNLWHINIYDFIIWLATCSTAVLLDLDIGLGVGIGVSIFTVIAQSQLSRGIVLGQAEDDEIYIEKKYRNTVKELDGVRMFKFNSNLYFATAEKFKNEILQRCFNPNSPDENMDANTKCVILDCSLFSYVDVTGVEVLKQVATIYKKAGVQLLYVRCSRGFVETLERAGFFEVAPRGNLFYDISDALVCVKAVTNGIDDVEGLDTKDGPASVV